MTPLDAAADDVHATAPQPHSLHQSIWPSIAAAGLLLLAVGLTVWLPLAIMGALAMAAAAWGVAREVNPLPTRRTDHDETPQPAQRADRAGTKYSWLAVGFSVSSAMVMIAILRAFVAHGLFDPAAWPEPARDLATPVAYAATGLLIASAAAAYGGGWLLRRRLRWPGIGALAAAVALALGYLVALGVQWVRLASAGFLPAGSGAASGYYALTGFHALTVLGSIALFGILSWHVAAGRLATNRDAVIASGIVYWTFSAAAWVVTFLVVHLRLVTWEGRVLI